MTLNSQSIKGKMDEFRGLVKVRKPHIIGVTESWGQPDIGDEVFMLDNYTMYRRDRVGKIKMELYCIFIRNLDIGIVSS